MAPEERADEILAECMVVGDWSWADEEKLNEAIAAAIREAETQRWIPVEERLPEPGQFVIALYPDYLHQVTAFGDTYGYTVRQLVADNGDRWADEGVTHWMPLPPPPGDEE